MYLLEMLPSQIAGETKIQPNYHGNIHYASKMQSYLADSENFLLEMSMVWRWAQWQTAVNICHLCDDRLHGKQTPAPPSAWWAGGDPAILFLHNPSKLLLQPVELVLARVEDLWREKKCSEVRQSRAASGMVLRVFSLKWLSMQCSTRVYLLMGPRLRKMVLERNHLFEHPVVPSRISPNCLMLQSGHCCAYQEQGSHLSAKPIPTSHELDTSLNLGNSYMVRAPVLRNQRETLQKDFIWRCKTAPREQLRKEASRAKMLEFGKVSKTSEFRIYLIW